MSNTSDSEGIRPIAVCNEAVPLFMEMAACIRRWLEATLVPSCCWPHKMWEFLPCLRPPARHASRRVDLCRLSARNSVCVQCRDPEHQARQGKRARCKVRNCAFRDPCAASCPPSSCTWTLKTLLCIVCGRKFALLQRRPWRHPGETHLPKCRSLAGVLSPPFASQLC